MEAAGVTRRRTWSVDGCPNRVCGSIVHRLGPHRRRGLRRARTGRSRGTRDRAIAAEPLELRTDVEALERLKRRLGVIKQRAQRYLRSRRRTEEGWSLCKDCLPLIGDELVGASLEAPSNGPCSDGVIHCAFGECPTLRSQLNKGGYRFVDAAGLSATFRTALTELATRASSPQASISLFIDLHCDLPFRAASTAPRSILFPGNSTRRALWMMLRRLDPNPKILKVWDRSLGRYVTATHTL